MSENTSVTWGAVAKIISPALALASALVAAGGSLYHVIELDDRVRAVEIRITNHEALPMHDVARAHHEAAARRLDRLETQQGETQRDLHEGLSRLSAQVAAICAATGAQCP